MDPTASSSLILPPGTRLQNFRIVRLLGRGGFGAIYLANDVSLGHRVAVKEYLPGDIAARATDSRVIPNHTDHEQLYQWGLDRFVKEARNLVRFRHPNIVRVSALFQENNTAYMVMDFEEGVSLREFVSQPENRIESRLKQLIKPIAQGLSEVHRQGFIHRDIKPGNLLVRNDGSPVLLDFGSARLASRHATHGLTALVSSGYAPLEQYNPESEEQQGPWSDVYALGGVLYYCLSQKDPADSTQRSLCIVNGQKDIMRSAMELGEGDYSEAFLRAIDWALSVRIADRPQMLGDWIPALFATDVPPDASVTTQRFLDKQTRLVTDSTGVAGSNQSPNSRQNPNANQNPNSSQNPNADSNSHSGDNPNALAKKAGNSGASRITTNKKLSDTGSSNKKLSDVMGKPSTPDDEHTIDKNSATRLEQDNWDKAMATAEQSAANNPLPTDATIAINPQNKENSKKAALRAEPGTSRHSRKKRGRPAVGGLFGLLILGGVAVAGWFGYQTVMGQLESQREVVAAQKLAADEALAKAESARQEALSAIYEQRERDAERERLGAERVTAQAEAERLAEEARQAKAAEQQESQAAEAAKQRAAAEKRAAEQKAREQAAARRAQEQRKLRDRQNGLLDDANSAIISNNFAQAQRLLVEAESIDVASTRIQPLKESLAAAQDNARQPISDQEFNAILGEFHQLKEAIENGNKVAIYRLTTGGDQAKLFTSLIDSFERIEMSITGIRARDADKSIVGTLRIDRMIRDNGNRATPSPSYQDRTISSQRINGDWSDIRW